MTDIHAGATSRETAAMGSDASAPPRLRAKEPCEWCGADTLLWRKCKQLCANCGQINRSCADL